MIDLFCVVKMTQYRQTLSVGLLSTVVFWFANTYVVARTLSSNSIPGVSDDLQTANSSKSETLQQSSTSKLTEGLLDLIESPTETKSPNVKPADMNRLSRGDRSTEPSSFQPNSPRPHSNLRQQMAESCQLLQQGHTAQAVRVQDEIVSELDRLIAQFEQNKSSKTSSQQSNKRQSAQQRSESNSKQTEPNDNSPTTPNTGNSPGDSAAQASSEVKLKNPTAMQQDVWGHLPAKVRSQMQSRMVEEFLPSYREKIESYYRETVQEGARQ